MSPKATTVPIICFGMRDDSENGILIKNHVHEKTGRITDDAEETNELNLDPKLGSSGMRKAMKELENHSS
jgi:hypothetical protein